MVNGVFLSGSGGVIPVYLDLVTLVTGPCRGPSCRRTGGMSAEFL